MIYGVLKRLDFEKPAYRYKAEVWRRRRDRIGNHYSAFSCCRFFPRYAEAFAFLRLKGVEEIYDNTTGGVI